MDLIELAELLKKVNPSEESFDWRSTRPSPEWQKLFTFHNEKNPGHRVGMGCRPCFKAVYDFTVKHLKENTVKND